MDCPQGVIDFSLYLRSTHHCPGEHVVSSSDPDHPDNNHSNMSTVLDQKNYIEELNRHLKYDPFKFSNSIFSFGNNLLNLP